MATVVEVLARLRADSSGFVRGMKDAEGATKRFESSVSSSGSRVGSALSTIGRGATVLGAAFGTAAAAAGGYGLKIAMANEQAAISFKTMLGSAEKADAFLRDLQGFAAKTPFEFPELRTAASRLLAVGVEAKNVIPLMTAIGDSTAAMGTGADGVNRAVYALQQMQQKGKIAGQEMMQLAEAGVPAYDALAAAIGKTVPETQKLVSEGKVGVQELMNAIQDYSGPALGRVKGMMDAQSQTLTGMLSTLKDTVALQLGDFMQPVVGAVKDQLPAFTTAIGDTLGALGPSIQEMMKALIPAIQGLLPVLQPVIAGFAQMFAQIMTAGAPILTALAKLLENLSPIFPDLADVVTALVEAFLPLAVILADSLVPVIVIAADVLRVLAQFLAQNAGVIKALAPVVVGITAAFIAFKMALGFVGLLKMVRDAVWMVNAAIAANPIGAIVLALIALGAGLVYAYNKFEGFRNIVDKVAGFVKGVFVSAFEKAKSVIGAVIGWISDHWRGLLQTFLLFLGPIGVIIAAVWKWKDKISDAVGSVVGFFKDIPQKIGSAFGSLANLILAPFRAAFNGIADAWNNTIGKLSFKAPSWIPGIGGKGFEVPDMPHLAKGGVVKKPTVAMIGEAGPEAVVPLKKLKANTADAAERMAAYKKSHPSTSAAAFRAADKKASTYGDSAAAFRKVEEKDKAMAAALAKIKPKNGGGGKGGTGGGKAKGPSVDKYVDTLQAKIDKKVSKAEESLTSIKDKAASFTGAIKDTVKSSYSFASAWEKVQGDIQVAKDNLQAAKDAMKDYATSVASAVAGQFSFSSALDAARGSGKGFMKQLAKNAAEARNFGALIQQLTAAGLDKGALDQVISAGAKSGTTMAKALLSGGSETINQANDLYRSVQQAATQTGVSTSQKFYQTGVDSAQEILNGLNSNLTLNLTTALANQATAATTFSDRVKALIAAGFSEEQIQQVLGAGVEAGTKIADALLAGGETTLADVTRLTTAVNDAADSAATAGYNKFYDAGVKLAQAVYDGWIARQKQFGNLLDSFGDSPTMQQAQTLAPIATAPLAPAKKAGTAKKAVAKKGNKKMAAGGIIPYRAGGSQVIVGERGPEAVIPLDKIAEAIPRAQAQGGGSNVNHVTIHVTTNDPARVVEAVRKYVKTSGGADRILK